MKTNYEKFLDLGKKGYVTFDEIENEIKLPKIQTKYIWDSFEIDNIAKREDDKMIIVDEKAFEKLARRQFVYDPYYDICTWFYDVFYNTLIKDDRFVQMIHDQIDEKFSVDIPVESRKTFCEVYLKSDEKKFYEAMILAAEYCKQFLEENKKFLVRE